MWSYICAIGLTGGLLFGAYSIGVKQATSDAQALVSESRATAAEKSLELERANTKAAEKSAQLIAATKAAERERALRVSSAARASGLDRCPRDERVRVLRNEALFATYPGPAGSVAPGTGFLPDPLSTAAARHSE